MSNALAIAAVTAILKDLLVDGLLDNDWSSATVGEVRITALPPDRISTTDTDNRSQLNLFLYQVTPNQGWRNTDLPSHDGNGSRMTSPPLALDLHYLLTAYSGQDLHGEILLGYAMQRLHETPVVSREGLRAAFPDPSQVTGTGLPPELRILANTGLADQVEQIKITPHYLNLEEMSKLWTSFQSHYRPSVSYQVSVVLIERKRAARSPMPVLQVGADNRGVRVQPALVPPYPTLTLLEPPNRQTSIRLGETLILRGHHLAGTAVNVLFSHRLLEEAQPVPVSVAAAGEIRVALPNEPNRWPAGLYTVQVTLTQAGQVRSTNQLPMALAPRILNATARRTGGAASDVEIELRISPAVWPEQTVALIVGEREAPAAARRERTDTLRFSVAGLADGNYYLRLRVDGVESILINRNAAPPEFFASEQVTIR
jgi:hypothetical protein